MPEPIAPAAPVAPSAPVDANISPVPATPAAAPAAINAGQENKNPNDVPVTTTKETPTPAPVTTPESLDDFFAGLGIVDDKSPATTPATPATEPVKTDTPAATEPAPVIPDAVKQQMADLQNAKDLAESNFKKVQPIAEALEKNPTMKKFFDAIASGKVTIEGVFQAFAEKQLSTPVKVPSSTAGTPPVQPSLQERMMNLSAAARESDNLNYKGNA